MQPGRAIVKVYRRTTPAGNFSYMVSNYADGERRRFDSYANEADAISAATKLAQRLDSRDYVAASMTREQAIEFANASARLKPFNVSVDASTATVAECLKAVGDLASLHAAVKFYAARHRQVTTKKTVAATVAELLAMKKARKKSDSYIGDLRVRLTRFAEAFAVDISTVTTADVQKWLDGLKLAPQTAKNFRTVVGTLFSFAESRGYIFKGGNPVDDTEHISANGGRIEIFTPDEITALLKAASRDFLPVIALGAFAGIRTAEIERLDWQDINLAEKFIVISADKAKTASRRIVPIVPNLAQWLAPYATQTGKMWKSTSCDLRFARAVCVKAAKTPWKSNGLRHSFISYRLADIQNAAQVALEAGNSPNVVFRHYRELVKPSTAKAWFSIQPATAAIADV